MKFPKNALFVFFHIWIVACDIPNHQHSEVPILNDQKYFYDSSKTTETEQTPVPGLMKILPNITGNQPPYLHGVSDSPSQFLLAAEFTASSFDATVAPSESSSLKLKMDEEQIKELNHILEESTVISAVQSVTHATEVTSPKTSMATVDGQSTLNDSTINAVSLNTTSKTTLTTLSSEDVSPATEAKTDIKGLFKQSLAWLGDTYTLGIVIPIVAGFLFAIVIIITLLTFSCIRRRCRRRRLRRHILPETIRKMGSSDRARLLAETSDEEF